MFDGFSFDKLLIVGVIAAFLLGPEKLPEVARRAAVLLKRLKELTDGAKSRLRDELGDEVAEIEWRRLDPRQYDPRRIIRDALDEAVPIQPSAPRADPRPALPAGDEPSLASPGAPQPHETRK